jgi:type IV fimbrial biogenesis protein FimT
MTGHHAEHGFTLIELMMVVAILAILASLATPAMEVIDKRRLTGATDTLSGHLQLARTEAVKHARDIFVTSARSEDGTNWCVGTSVQAGCNCFETNPGAADACILPVLDSDGQGGTLTTRVLKTLRVGQFETIRMTQAIPETRFDFVRGTVVSGGGTLILRSPQGRETRVNVNVTGRVNVCSPAGASSVGGYRPC